MSLAGTLRDFSISQLLSLVKLAKKTGSLIINDSNKEFRLYFDDGLLTYTHDQSKQTSLIEILREYGVLDADQINFLLQKRADSDKELGMRIINGSLVSQNAILSGLSDHYEGLIMPLFSWFEGDFRFDELRQPPKDKITVKMGLEKLIIEGSRKVHEFDNLKLEIPSLDVEVRFPKNPSASIKDLSLERQEWRVISYVRSGNNLQTIANKVNLNELQIRKIIYGLIQAGVLEFVPTEKEKVELEEDLLSEMEISREEKLSIIGRIIKRIRTL